METTVPLKGGWSDWQEDHVQTLSRLRKMKQRWQEKPPAKAESLFDRISVRLSSERTRALRGAVHWFAKQQGEDFMDAVSRQLGGKDTPWREHDDRKRSQSYGLEFRHKTNVPHEFDKFDRAELEQWLKMVDPAGDECEDLMDVHDTMELRRIADYRSYEKDYQAPLHILNQDANAAIGAQLKAPAGRDADGAPMALKPKVRERVILAVTELNFTTQLEHPTEDEPKMMIRVADDAVAEEAAAIVNSISSACQV